MQSKVLLAYVLRKLYIDQKRTLAEDPLDNSFIQGFFLRFRFGGRKEILRDHLEEFERPFSIDVISGHYILIDCWRNLRHRFGPSKHLKKNTGFII